MTPICTLSVKSATWQSRRMKILCF